MKSDQIRSDRVWERKEGKKESGWFLGCTITLPLFYSHIYQRSDEKKGRNHIRLCLYVYVCVFRSSHIVYQRTYSGGGRW